MCLSLYKTHCQLYSESDALFLCIFSLFHSRVKRVVSCLTVYMLQGGGWVKLAKCMDSNEVMK